MIDTETQMINIYIDILKNISNELDIFEDSRYINTKDINDVKIKINEMQNNLLSDLNF